MITQHKHKNKIWDNVYQEETNSPVKKLKQIKIN